MSRLRYNRDRAVEHLRSRCDHLCAFIEQQGRLDIRVRREPSLFNALARAIAYQQLSGKAAATIYGRFEALFPANTPTPEGVLALPMDALRGAGLSQNKALAIRDLAGRAVDGRLHSHRDLVRLDDGEVVEHLCQVRGVGPWTAQMYLMFNLGRPDVMPAADLGVQKGVQAIYRMRKLPTPDQVLRRTRHLAPYRSAASWYFWRAADTELLA